MEWNDVQKKALQFYSGPCAVAARMGAKPPKIPQKTAFCDVQPYEKKNYFCLLNYSKRGHWQSPYQNLIARFHQRCFRVKKTRDRISQCYHYDQPQNLLPSLNDIWNMHSMYVMQKIFVVMLLNYSQNIFTISRTFIRVGLHYILILSS